MPFTLIPRNPFPHSLGDLARAFGSRQTSDSFLKECLTEIEQTDGFLVSSGRQAFYLILASLLKPGDEIILPAFSCNVLLDVIVKTGVLPVFADVSTSSLNMEAEQVEACLSPRTRAVVMTHQFGYPTEAEKLRSLCRQHSLLLIEDAAPAFGAHLRGTPVGKFGDVAFFSFERSKVISTFDGGLVVGRKELLDSIRSRFAQKESSGSLSHFVKGALLSLLQSRLMYPLTYSAWKLRHGSNSAAGNWTPDIGEYGESFDGLSRYQSALGHRELSNLKAILKERARVTERFRNIVSQSHADVLVPQVPEEGRESSYSRFPLLVSDKESFHAVARSVGLDLGYTFSYKLSQYRKEWDRPVPNTDFIIKHIVNVPISRSPRMNDEIARRLERALAQQKSYSMSNGIMLPPLKQP